MRADVASFTLKSKTTRDLSNMNDTAWITTKKLEVELGFTRRTIDRWLQPKNAHLNFPQPHRVNKRKYFDRSAIEAWKTTTAVKSAGA